MGQQMTDQIAFLTEARTALEGLELSRDREKQLKLDESKVGKALDAEKKSLEDNISSTVRKRRDAIASSYDAEIDKAEDKLKKARVKREKAKNQGMKERIAEETADLRSDTREVEGQIRALFKQKHVPAFCNSGWYYALFLPRRFGEYFLFLLIVLVCFLAIPYGAYMLIPERQPLHLAAVYFAAILIFGGTYILLTNKTKARHMDTLKEARIMRDHIHSNKKKIKVIVKTIQRDKNEKIYNLEKYDDEISQLEQEIQRIGEQKKEALNSFEQVTKTIISDEIVTAAKPKIEELTSRYRQIRQEVEKTEEEIKQKNLEISGKYAGYLGKEYMDPIKIGELMESIRSGRASTISEAMEDVKKSGNP